MPAGARPAAVLAGRPAAERASDAGARGIEALLLITLAIQDDGRFGCIIQGTRRLLLRTTRAILLHRQREHNPNDAADYHAHTDQSVSVYYPASFVDRTSDSCH
jgi:hypothetical protein